MSEQESQPIESTPPKTSVDQGPLSYYGLTPERYEYLGDVPLRLNADLRKAVFFLGDVTADQDGKDVFKAKGTAFFLDYKGMPYAVTARHVAETISKDPPYFIRASDRNGDPVLVEVEHADWFYPEDENVDLALGVGATPNATGVGDSLLLTKEITEEKRIGIGDEVHIVGLYRLAYGKKRNLPVVHSGSIAMVPEGEPIPQIDTVTGKRRMVECYVVEAQTLSGLSGSPVFVRGVMLAENEKEKVLLSIAQGYLLGVWSGAWDAAPGAGLATEHPAARKVPVGMGLTVPSYKLIELLESPIVSEHRAKFLEKRDAAKQDKA